MEIIKDATDSTNAALAILFALFQESFIFILLTSVSLCDYIISPTLYFVKRNITFLLTFYHISDIIVTKGGENVETINDRVMILRKKLEMNQTEFAKTLAIKQAALSMIENGQREVSEKNIKLICATHNVNYEWLVNGIEPMFRDVDLDFSDICAAIGAKDEKAKSAIMKYFQLSPDDKDLFWKFMERFVK